jgi:hypothetical protein
VRKRRLPGWRDIGRRVRLQRAMVTKGGTNFALGEIVRVVGSWRGRLELEKRNGKRIRRVDPREVSFLDPPNTTEVYDRLRSPS